MINKIFILSCYISLLELVQVIFLKFPLLDTNNQFTHELGVAELLVNNYSFFLKMILAIGESKINHMVFSAFHDKV
jgi:hypothetical protein